MATRLKSNLWPSLRNDRRSLAFTAGAANSPSPLTRLDRSPILKRYVSRELGDPRDRLWDESQMPLDQLLFLAGELTGGSLDRQTAIHGGTRDRHRFSSRPRRSWPNVATAFLTRRLPGGTT